jgi:hypothetical protein
VTRAIRNVRLAQMIGPFGPGAIVDLVGESFVAMDASRWRGRPIEVRMPRLAKRLGVSALHSPSQYPGVPYYRFPTWLFCRRCRLMTRRLPQTEKRDQPPMCTNCTDLALVPMRFVAVCGNGHLSDINWRKWAHQGADSREQRQCQEQDRLHFVSLKDRGSGLASLEVQCHSCDASHDLDRITSKGVLRQKCSGKQPWQRPAEADDCEEQLVGTQRGASNVYFPEVVSALDIPPESNWDNFSSPATRLHSNDFFKGLLKNPSVDVRDQLIALVAHQEGLSPDEVEQALIGERNAAVPDAHEGTEEDITPEEWHALRNPRTSAANPLDHFITRRAPVPGTPDATASQGPDLRGFLSDTILVDRLREVRVLKGFSRYTGDRSISSNLGPADDFLPAVEVFGEGYFIAFHEKALREWEARPEVQKRHRAVLGRAQQADLRWLPPVTARFLMLHSLAHLLLRSTAFDAGYPVSALKERIYATRSDDGPDMGGILVYTAAGDTEGTLGGLVRMGEPERLRPLLLNAVVDAQWCSLDPVCGESTSQGPAGLSLAACHACTLLPETSCQAGNRLLDRRLVVDPAFGFLADLAADLDGIPGRGIW